MAAFDPLRTLAGRPAFRPIAGIRHPRQTVGDEQLEVCGSPKSPMDNWYDRGGIRRVWRRVRAHRC